MGNSLTQYKGHSVADNNRDTAIDVTYDHPLPVQDPWLAHAVAVIESTYGDKISIAEKDKDLIKFGQSEQVQTTLSTIMDLPSGTFNETYSSTNSITHFSSSSGSDTVEIVVEGHTVDGNGDFTFSTQTVTLAGQTKTALTTPLARCNRVYNNDSTDLVGTVYVYEDDTVVAGVPSTGSKVHCMVPAGYNQSRKCATTLSSQDYWIVTEFGTGVNEKTAAYVDSHLEVRLKGKVFRQQINISAQSGNTSKHHYGPYLIVPPNSDVRIRAEASANGTDTSAHIQGVLAIIT